MKMGRTLLSLSMSVVLLAGCSSNGSPASGSSGNPFNPPPVEAASYSNSSFTGTYGFSVVDSASGENAVEIGTFSADGNGNVANGTATLMAYGVSCNVTFTGNYSLQSDGKGTATLAFEHANDDQCTVTPSVEMTLQATQQGQLIYFAENNGSETLSGSAARE